MRGDLGTAKCRGAQGAQAERDSMDTAAKEEVAAATAVVAAGKGPPDLAPVYWLDNKHLQKFIVKYATLCEPQSVVICDGSAHEWSRLTAELVEAGTMIKLNEKKRKDCYLARSDPSDVARVESRTFICTTYEEDAGPTNNWAEPDEMKQTLHELYKGCMRGRTMYVIPFCMGPIDSPLSRCGIQLTDSAFVVVNMHIMTRVGTAVLQRIGKKRDFVPCVHSVGKPLAPGEKDVRWPCNKNKYICHFPEDPSIMSYGSAYGGNALLSKKCFALRIASTMGLEEGWMAEHCLILGLTQTSTNQTHYIAAAFPSACGKTNLAMLVPTIPGLKVTTVGDDIAWMRQDKDDNRLYAINPENGFFGVAPGTSSFTNPSAMAALTEHCIFTNVALTPDGDVWWDGMTPEPPAELEDWTFQKWTPDCGRPAAHPNARYTAPAANCPVMDPRWQDPKGVPISAIVFGGRRATTVPLVTEAFSWQHGVFMGSMCSSEQTAAAEGKAGTLRIDPFAMLPFIGYNCGEYEKHWLDMGERLGGQAPQIFYVNWFRKDAGGSGRFLWPGFGENSRVLKWMLGRLDGSARGRHTPVGVVPAEGAVDLHGLKVTKQEMQELLLVNPQQWLDELPQIRAHQDKLGEFLPPALRHELVELELRLHFALRDNAPTTNKRLSDWVRRMTSLCKPEHVFWCDGSREEYQLMCDICVETGTFVRLDPKKRPNSYLARSHPNDVARVESRTFVCTTTLEEAGPTNNWFDPAEMRKILEGLFDGAMQGRTLFVIPFSMGPLDSPYSRVGVQITDSPYVVANMHIMTRVGFRVLRMLGKDGSFVKCLHSVGRPLAPAELDVAWPCNETKYISHFPHEADGPEIMSFGSGGGGNALLGKKCLALRIASEMGRREGWMAEHMLILGLEMSGSKKSYITAALPSQCGKTNLAMLVPTVPGMKVTTLGDDIAWMHPAPDGSLRAMNPESGFFGVAPGTSSFTNPSAMAALGENVIFTNCALTPDGDVWWEGMTPEPPAELEDWQGQKWTPDCGRLAAHPNARYTVPAINCPVLDPDWENPEGVPVSAVLFGGRRGSTIPLVTESFSWQHGVFMGAMCASEQTAAAEGKLGELRFDPYAMLPFCGYNMGDYMRDNWLAMGKRLADINEKKMPRIFYVNWFQKDPQNGRFLWPGFGDNARVLKWVVQRVENQRTGGVSTPIGILPAPGALDLSGLELAPGALEQLLKVDAQQWLDELPQVRKFHAKLEAHWPEEIHRELTSLEQRLHFAAVEQVPCTDAKLIGWVKEMKALCEPEHVHWCDGSEEEYQLMCDVLVEAGTFVRLNPKKRPNSFLARSDPKDVARVESRTFICSEKQEDAGPTNNWREPEGMKKELNEIMQGCMRGRTMYVIPFVCGPIDSPYARFGVEITDSPYVVVNLKIMTRIGFNVLRAMQGKFWLPCFHSVCKSLKPNDVDSKWPCDDPKYICHFPDGENPQVISLRSGYGGNALLPKKCYGLRMASVLGRREGWLAEHCLILGITNPAGKKYYVAAAFPSACGKTNFALMVPTIPGWSVSTVGDDLAWMHIGKDGRLRAINPESGFFGVAPGTSDLTNHSVMEALKSDSIYTNVGLTPDGDVWWEGMSTEPPAELEDWTYQKWTPGCGRKAAHPNARYTAPAGNCPVIDPDWENPEGVPISAIIFGGRRETTIPLVNELSDWVHGVFAGSVCSSEQTAAAEGKVGSLRIDPMAMLPFFGYSVTQYFEHWLSMGAKLGEHAPRIFYVNFFRKDASGRFMWPGFGENVRLLKWIVERIEGTASAVATPIGNLPPVDALDVSGLSISPEDLKALLSVDRDNWLVDIPRYEAFYEQLGGVPEKLKLKLAELKKSLENYV
ncbi:Phosphoenolpyruvate carboxykinase, GTP [Porphyridium purpureum]|uniref:phosphoenolpyruvate carboxykinase (GTP) n=1 Tax=Porphyridium purpureum TaxID=35688 RepID=A0A5J4Z006_PORPP|nr:Phosphoenolpyruvate carboxykinase, GTP [Porphyridium purpureum]|eukprot:POR8724..scf209_3